MTAPVRITGALFVDLGEQLHGGTWIRQPRARYECLLCHTREGPVTGPAAVRAFVDTIRATHKTNCRPIHHQQGAHAA